jgi:hypothetical protein
MVVAITFFHPFYPSQVPQVSMGQSPNPRQNSHRQYEEVQFRLHRRLHRHLHQKILLILMVMA